MSGTKRARKMRIDAPADHGTHKSPCASRIARLPSALFRHVLSFIDVLDAMGVCATSSALAAGVAAFVAQAPTLCLDPRDPADRTRLLPAPFAGAAACAMRLICCRARAVQYITLFEPVMHAHSLDIVRLVARCRPTLRTARLLASLHGEAGVWRELAACPNLEHVWLPRSMSVENATASLIGDLPTCARRVKALDIRGDSAQQVVAGHLLGRLDSARLETVRLGRIQERFAGLLARLTNCRVLRVGGYETAATGRLVMRAVEQMSKLAHFHLDMNGPISPRMSGDDADPTACWNLPPSLECLNVTTHGEALVADDFDPALALAFRAPNLHFFDSACYTERGLALVLDGAPALAALDCDLMCRCEAGNPTILAAIRRNGPFLRLGRFHIGNSSMRWVAEAVVVAAVDAFEGLSSLKVGVCDRVSAATVAYATCRLPHLRHLALLSKRVRLGLRTTRMTQMRLEDPECESLSTEAIGERVDALIDACNAERTTRPEEERKADSSPAGPPASPPESLEQDSPPCSAPTSVMVGNGEMEAETEGEGELPVWELQTLSISSFDVGLLAVMPDSITTLQLMDPAAVGADLAVVFRELPNLEALVLQLGRGAHCEPRSISNTDTPDNADVPGTDPSTAVESLQTLSLDCFDEGFSDWGALATWCPNLATLAVTGVNMRRLGKWLLATPDALVDLEKLVVVQCEKLHRLPTAVEARLRLARPRLSCSVMSQDEHDSAFCNRVCL